MKSYGLVLLLVMSLSNRKSINSFILPPFQSLLPQSTPFPFKLHPCGKIFQQNIFKAITAEVLIYP